MANDMTYTQAAAVLTEIIGQATGKFPIAPVNSAQFTNVAQTALKIGYDPLMQAISLIMNRTIFVIRPYMRKFRGLEVSNQRFGGFTRKLQLSDTDFTNDKTYELKDGESVDMYKISMPKPLQTNFYGQVVFKRQLTTFIHQLDLCFRNAEELAQFWTMQQQNSSDLIESAHEGLARAVICNIIAGKTICDPKSCIHLVSEYNKVIGQNYTTQEIMSPDIYSSFVKWAYARIAAISSMLTERTLLYQVNIDGTNTPHHTPYARQRVYLFAPDQYSINARVMADTFHDTFLRLAYNESVNFWQSAETTDEIDVTPVYLQTTGALNVGAETKVQKVFGVIMDEESAGYTVVNQWSSTTPLNSDGGYWNTFFHFTDRYLNDFTEKCVVLLMD